MAQDGVEIERKYLLRGVPEAVAGVPFVEIEQGWLPGASATEGRERLRRSVGAGVVRWTRTIKTGSGIARQEFEEAIPLAEFERLWPGTAGCRVAKRRSRIAQDDLVWEIDVFHDRELVLAEVELPAVDTVVVLPDWLAPHVEREVTDEGAFTNLALAS